MTINLGVTLAAIGMATALAAWMILLERRGPTPGSPRLIPTTPILFMAVLALVLALAHLVTILTGSPHTGRML